MVNDKIVNKESFDTQFRRFLWSSILIALSACLGNVVDAIIVGNLIGEDGVSAINLSKPITQFMFTVSMLLSTGAGMLVGMELGKKDHERAASLFTLSTVSCLAFGLLMTLCGVFFTDGITHWLCKNQLLYNGLHDYLFPMLLGSPMYMASWALATMVGVDGSPRLVSIAILIDNAVNLFLDIVFIQWLGWGIEGSSAATVLGHLVGIAIMCRHFFYADNHLIFHTALSDRSRHSRDKKSLNLQTFKSQMRDIVSQGAPLAAASICLTVLLYSANSIVLGSMGRIGIFAFSVCMNLLQIYNLFLSGTCRTLQSLGSIQVGKGDGETFRLVLRKSFRFISVAMMVTCLATWVFPEEVTRFFGADEPELIGEGAHALRIFALSFIPFCYIYTLMIVYKLYGYHKMALFISLALSLTVIPVLWFMGRYAPAQLWYSYLIAYAIEIILIILFHKLGKMEFKLKGDIKVRD